MESLSKIENARERSLCGENKILGAVVFVALIGNPSRRCPGELPRIQIQI